MGKTVVDDKERIRLRSNIFSLGLLQIANYVLPLLTIPYLVRILGPEYFGLIAFATAITAYLILITDYGFNLTATRQIAICREDLQKISEIVCTVFLIKFILLGLSLILLCLLYLFVDKVAQHWSLYFILFGTVIGQVLFPTWLFQGMEKMQFISYFNLAARLFFTVCVFILVKDQDDYILVPLLSALASLFVGIFAAVSAKRLFSITLFFPPKQVIWVYVVEGWDIFLSSISVSLYTLSTTVVLGVFSDNTTVGYFSAADKIIQAAKGLYVPISQAVYPVVSRRFAVGILQGKDFVKRLFVWCGTTMAILSLLLFGFSDTIVDVLLGDDYGRSIVLLQIMSFLPLLTCLSNILGVQTMLNLGLKKQFNLIISLSAVIGLVLAFLFVPRYESMASAIILVIIEFGITLVMGVYLKVKIGDRSC